MPTPRLRAAALALFAVALAGCPAPAEVTADAAGPPVGPGPAPSAPAASRSPELDAARERWEAAGLSGYEMTLRRICFCPSPDYTGPFEVTVRGGELEAVARGGTRVDDERGETVEGLFDLIEDAYTRKAQSVTVEFDPELGYPANLSIDYSFQMADEEIGYMVSDLRPVR